MKPTQEALRILARKIAREILEKQTPEENSPKIKALIAKRNDAREQIKIWQEEFNKINKEICKTHKEVYHAGNYIFVKKDYSPNVPSESKIYEDLVLGFNFEAKSLEILKKELIAKYSKK